jgi:hypothetical protein
VSNLFIQRLKFTLFIYGLKLKLYLYFSKSIHIVEKKTRNHNIRNTRLPLCNEDNTVDINHIILLFIVDPPFVTVNQSLYYVQTGNMVTLVCNVSSSLPLTDVQWEKNSNGTTVRKTCLLGYRSSMKTAQLDINSLVLPWGSITN